MRSLYFALHAEGTSDKYFPASLLTRVIQGMVAESPETIEVIEPLVFLDSDPRFEGLSRVDRILNSACSASKSDILVVHCDADASRPKKAKSERFDPGNNLVQQRKSVQAVCTRLIPIIPIRMIESWMFADPDALCKALRTDLKPTVLDVPSKAHTVEKIPHPKEKLNEIIFRACSGRRRVDTEVLFGELGRTVNLERLRAVPAFKQFVTDIMSALIDLGIFSA